MAADLALGILTRGRPGLAIEAVRSAFTGAAKPLQVFVLVDDDHSAVEAIASYFEGNPRVAVGHTPLRHYYVRGMNLLYGWMRECEVDRFVVSNDDVRFVPGWDETALAAFDDAFPRGGILELAGPELCAHYLSCVPFIEEHFGGRIAEPAYTFYCSDTELRERARALGRYAWHATPLIEHLVRDDAVRADVAYWMPFDRAVYKERWQPGWRRELWQEPA